MSHILFGTVNTKTYGLIVAPYEIPMPLPRTDYVEIPGKDGSLDLSEAFGRVLYSDRVIPITLYAVGAYDANVSAFVNTVHGKRKQITFSKDPTYYYNGRVSVVSFTKQDGYCEIGLEITAEPYKLEQTETSVSRSKNGTVTLKNGRMPVVPTITNTQEATITFTYNGASVQATLAAGTHTVPTLVLGENETKSVTVASTGKTTFKFRKGAI